MTETVIITITLLLIVSPIAIAFWLRRRQVGTWTQFGIGATALLGAQIASQFLWGIISPNIITLVLLALIQALLIEGGLYLAYHFFLPDVQTERQVLMVGAGRVGANLILTGLTIGIIFMNVLAFTNADPTTLDATPEEIADYQQAADEYWESSPLLQISQALQAVLDFPIQLALTLLVWSAFRTQSGRVFGLAVGAHLALLLTYSFLGLLGWLIAVLIADGLAIRFLRQQWPALQKQAAAPKKAAKKRKVKK